MSKRGDFYESVCILCEKHKGSMTSGYRTEIHNKSVGGSEHSQHRYGLALDVILDDMSEQNRLLFVKDARRFSVVAVDEVDHIHVQALPRLHLG